MPRPNAKWVKKYVTKKELPKSGRLAMGDNLLTAATKLAGYNSESYEIIVKTLTNAPHQNTCVWNMDKMEMYDDKIVIAFHDWAKNSDVKLREGILICDPSLVTFLKGAE